VASALEWKALSPERDITMLYTIAVILVIAWLLGLVGTFTLGPILHLLLVVAVIVFIVGLVSGRRVLG
jgi:Family of unknown function (DUF5670)